jgi:hypothetical protein
MDGDIAIVGVSRILGTIFADEFSVFELGLTMGNLRECVPTGAGRWSGRPRPHSDGEAVRARVPRIHRFVAVVEFVEGVFIRGSFR